MSEVRRRVTYLWIHAAVGLVLTVVVAVLAVRASSWLLAVCCVLMMLASLSSLARAWSRRQRNRLV